MSNNRMVRKEDDKATMRKVFLYAAVTLTVTRSPVQSITLEEVRAHDSSSDCWSIVYETVYDLTNYGASHSRGGGPDRVWSMCGTDGTSLFDSAHSSRKEYLQISSIQNLGAVTVETDSPVTLPPLQTDPPTVQTVPPVTLPPTLVSTLQIDPPTVQTNSPTTDAPAEPITSPPTSLMTSDNPTSTPTTLTPNTEMPTTEHDILHSSVSVEELELHSSSEDCWVLFFNSVYDMTEYAYQHPGSGSSVIHDVCGENGTQPFAAFHPENYLEQYLQEQDYVGPIDVNSKNETTAPPKTDLHISELNLLDHNDPDDCWVAYYGVVYDMTAYAYLHPGPREAAIHPWCGQDGTTAFAYFHDETYLNSIESYQVGQFGGTSSAHTFGVHFVCSLLALILLMPYSRSDN
jgi:cytochrome b involved in lipid metabolism